jgi:hypothetical protein
MLDLPTTLAPRSQQRVEFLIHLLGRLAMRMLAMLLPGAAPRPAWPRHRLPGRERRRPTLPRPPRFLQLPLKLHQPRRSRSFSPTKRVSSEPQLLVLSRPAPKLIHRLGRQHLNT